MDTKDFLCYESHKDSYKKQMISEIRIKEAPADDLCEKEEVARRPKSSVFPANTIPQLFAGKI